MKIREKKYLFEGFLNVLIIVLISLATGFVMGLVSGMFAYQAQISFIEYGLSK